MALKTWLWNLGATGVVVAGGCGPVLEVPQDTEGTDTGGNDTEGVDTEFLPTGGRETEPGTVTVTTDPPCNSYCYDSYGDSYYDTDYYDTDYYDTGYYDPECEGDEDCELGECIDAGEPWSYCEPLPIPDSCPQEPALQTAWVTQGEGAGSAAGMPDSDRVVLLDAGGVPVSVASSQGDGVPVPLPVTLGPEEQVIGSSAADLDGDGDGDLVLSIRDESSLRVVPMILAGGGTYAEGPSTTFDGTGDPAKLQRYADGSVGLLVRLDTGLLYESAGQGDGSFSSPEPSAWATDPIAGFATGFVDVGISEDLAVMTLEGGQSRIDLLLDGGELPVGVLGSASRSLHVDARNRWLVTVDRSKDGQTTLGRIFTEVNASDDPLLVLDGGAPVLATTVTDLDADGRSDVVLLRPGGALTVVFGVSTGSACTQELELGADFDSVHRPGSGAQVGLVLSGAEGVLAVGPAG